MSNQIIRAFFEERLGGWAAAQAPPLPIAKQNQEFTRPAMTLDETPTYLRCFLLPAATDSMTLSGTHRRYTGLFQVSVFVAPRIGTDEAERLTPLLDALFPVAVPFAYQGLRIVVMRPMSASSPIDDDEATSVSISCRYEVNTT